MTDCWSASLLLDTGRRTHQPTWKKFINRWRQTKCWGGLRLRNFFLRYVLITRVRLTKTGVRNTTSMQVSFEPILTSHGFCRPGWLIVTMEQRKWNWNLMNYAKCSFYCARFIRAIAHHFGSHKRVFSPRLLYNAPRQRVQARVGANILTRAVGRTLQLCTVGWAFHTNATIFPNYWKRVYESASSFRNTTVRQGQHFA